MSRVPRYTFRAIVTRRTANNGQQIEQHNYTNLAGAISYREIALRRRDTRKVEIVMVIDETTPHHSQQQEEGDNIRAFRASSLAPPQSRRHSSGLSRISRREVPTSSRRYAGGATFLEILSVR